MRINMVIDSDMRREDILAQNPQNPAPQNILDSLEILKVVYYGFDNKLHRGQIVINKGVAAEANEFFNVALKIEFPIEKVIPISNEKYRWDDMISCDDNNSSGFNYRLVMGTNRISKHATGLAFDINPAQNIYVRYDKNMNEISRFPKGAVYNKSAKGTLTPGHPLVALMKNLGWEWGGDWKPESGRIDYQHFEKI